MYELDGISRLLMFNKDYQQRKSIQRGTLTDLKHFKPFADLMNGMELREETRYIYFKVLEINYYYMSIESIVPLILHTATFRD